MKNRIFVFFLVLCGLLFQVSHGQAQRTIRIATEEYPPYTSQNLNHFGIDAHIVSEAFKSQGIAVEYQFFPEARSFKLAVPLKNVCTICAADRSLGVIQPEMARRV